MQDNVSERQRIVPLRLGNIRVHHPLPVNHRHRLRSDNLENSLRRHNQRRILVDAHPKNMRILGNRRQKTVYPAPLGEMLVDHHFFHKAHPVRHAQRRLFRRLARPAVDDHRVAHHRCAGARAGYHHPAPVCTANSRVHLRPAENTRQSELVAAGEENPCAVIQLAVMMPGVSRLAVGHRYDADACGSQFGQDSAVFLPCLAGVFGGRSHNRNNRIASAGHRHELAQNNAISPLVLVSADNKQVACTRSAHPASRSIRHTNFQCYFCPAQPRSIQKFPENTAIPDYI